MFASVTDEFAGTIRKSKKASYIFRGVTCLVFFAIGLPFITRVGELSLKIKAEKTL